MVIVLGIAIGVVGLKVSPNITILAAIGMVMLYAVIKIPDRLAARRDHQWHQTGDHSNLYFYFSRFIDCCMDTSRNYSNPHGHWI